MSTATAFSQGSVRAQPNEESTAAHLCEYVCVRQRHNSANLQQHFMSYRWRSRAVRTASRPYASLCQRRGALICASVTDSSGPGSCLHTDPNDFSKRQEYAGVLPQERPEWRR
ncbi:hypothetical protein SKAU_G00306520 [Synaphobranchus kaupii]|uniref:Uncharacterized protein n=1 Tax=Synaphobranchus kaupii TaxID=118154 RepID=A0A9Q1EQZ5_SYNKA|nr:hypothetical protein SKAU_G00306520 [Synaphobranchus kaupii]